MPLCLCTCGQCGPTVGSSPRGGCDDRPAMPGPRSLADRQAGSIDGCVSWDVKGKEVQLWSLTLTVNQQDRTKRGLLALGKATLVSSGLAQHWGQARTGILEKLRQVSLLGIGAVYPKGVSHLRPPHTPPHHRQAGGASTVCRQAGVSAPHSSSI